MKTVLFVCAGNTCRSPMAEAIFNDKLTDYPKLEALDFHAESAGTFASDGAPMAKEAIQALKALNVEPERKHRSQSFSAALAEEAILILGVQEMIVEEILALAPQVEDRTHTLCGYGVYVDGLVGSEQYDIEDPYRESQEVYLECAQQLERAVEKVLLRLEKEWTE